MERIMAQSVRLIGRHFQGVVASRGLLPDASQDVAKVFSERARIVVADGAGDTGGAAGEWAGVLALCYGTSQEMEQAPEPEWLGRAVNAWNHASNLSRSTMQGSSVNQQELALLQRGVDASFIGAAFEERVGTLSAHLVAAGDCEAFLFRAGFLLDCVPIRDRAGFSSVARSLNSKAPKGENLIYTQWQLQDGDVLILCSDALAQFIITACCNNELVPSEVESLILCTEWQELRQHIATWREERRLRNDDVAMVRVSINEGPCTARFSLVQDKRSYARETTVEPVATNKTTLASLPEAVQHKASNAASAQKPTQSQTPDEAKISRPILYSLIITFLVGVLVGAVLPLKSTPSKKIVDEMAEERRADRREAGSRSAIQTPMQSPSLTPLNDRQSAAEVVNTREPETTVKMSRTVNQQEATRTLTSGEEERPKNDNRAANSGFPGEGQKAVTSATPIRTGGPSRQEDAPLPESALGNAGVTSSADPTPASTPMPLEVRPEVESGSPEGGATEPRSVATPREEEQADHKTSDANTQPTTLQPCILPKETRLYSSTAEGKTSILVVKASHVMCVVNSSTSQDDQRVTISAWLKIVPKSDGDPEWLSDGLVKETIDVRTAPFGDDGSEYLGKVKRGTAFIVGRREKRNGESWVELKIAAYRITE